MENHLRILIHSLSKDTATLVEKNLSHKDFSFEILHSSDHKQLLTAVRSSSPHLVITEHHPPDVDSFDMLKILQSEASTIPVIVIVDDVDADIGIRLLVEGASDCVQRSHLARIGLAATASLTRQEGDNSLRQNQAMFHLITENVSDLIAVMDVQGKRLYNSRSYQKTFGSLEGLEGTDSFGEIHPDDRERIRNIFQETVKTGVGRRTEFRFVRKDGTTRYVESVGSVTRDSSGKVDRVLVVSRDITEQREAEYQLRMLAYALTGTKDCVSLSDLEDTVLFVNEAFAHTFGYAEDEIIGRNINIVRSEQSAGREILAATVKDGAWSGEIFNRRKDGTEFPVELWSSLVKDNDGNPVAVVGIARDISERKRGEEALRKSEERYRLFFEEDLTGDFISTPDGHLLSCNPAFVRMFGFESVEHAMSTNLSALYPDPAGRAKFLEKIIQNRKLEYYETELHKIDGTPLYVVENAIGIFDHESNLLRIKGYLFDNTRRKELEDQLLHAQKMEAIGQLAGGIAHEFNNVLNTILAAAETIKTKSDDQATHSLSRMIESSAIRGGGIAKQLLQFARARNTKLTPISMPQVVMDVWKIIEHSFPKSIRLNVETSVSEGYVQGDPTQLQQMLLNLCLNARDAMSPSDGEEPTGMLTISLDFATSDFVDRKFGKATEEKYIVLCVADTGHGMDEETRRRIFEPFFSTKEVGKGTGLGLSIVHGIVGSHGGYIDTESTPGRGARFIVYLPCVSHTPIPSAAPVAESSGGNGECVLVVEDDESVRSLLCEWILQAGYEVLEADNGSSGLEIYRSNQNSIHLVLTDIGMPKLGGARLFREIRKINSSVPVLFCTGFIEEERGAELMKAGASGIIQKPFRPSDILTSIREALDRGTTHS